MPTREIFLILISALIPACTIAKSGTNWVVTSADLGVISASTTGASGGITSLVGNVDAERQTLATQAEPGEIVVGDIVLKGTVQHSSTEAERWWGARGLARVWGSVEIGKEFFQTIRFGLENPNKIPTP